MANKCEYDYDDLKQMEGLSCYNNVNIYDNENENENGCGGGGGNLGMKKRVMVVVDDYSSSSKHAMIWALTNVTNRGDLFTLLHIVSPHKGSTSSSTYLANSLGSLCKSCQPEVDVEALVIQGPKLATIMSQVKKLEVSVLVLGQRKSSPLLNCMFGRSGNEEFVDKCINCVDCLTIGVRKQSRGIGGYLISTRWQKNFWLLA
ncbi:hypothetical protein ACFE04_025993 [Oxalis oulophora]